MVNDYNMTIRNMIMSNENLKELLINGNNIDSFSNKIVNLELFFLAFKLFENEFEKLDIYDSWKELFIKQDYIIDGDRIIFEDKEVSYQLIEITFINLMINYKKSVNRNIIPFTGFTNIGISSSKIEKDNIVELKIEEDHSIEEPRSKLDKYIVDKSSNMENYLSFISGNFRECVYDGIVNIYNLLKDTRDNRMFKTNLSLIIEDDKNDKIVNDMIIFLLNMYPIHYYGKDKVFIRYDYLKMPDILVDANHFKFDNAWEMLTKRLEILDYQIDRLNKAKNSKFVKKKDKIRYMFRLTQLENDKKRVLEQIFSLGAVNETIEYDGEYIESFYSGELLNKHIIYNLELAINKGYVDFRRNTQGKEEAVFYAINGKEVDFIMHIDVDKLAFAIDNMNVISLFKSDDGIRKVLR